MITIKIPGRALLIAMEGGYPQDCPSGYEALKSAPHVKRGRGITYVVKMERADAIELRDYLDGVHGVLACMTSEERGGLQGLTEMRAARSGADAIDKQLTEQR